MRETTEDNTDNLKGKTGEEGENEEVLGGKDKKTETTIELPVVPQRS